MNKYIQYKRIEMKRFIFNYFLTIPLLELITTQLVKKKLKHATYSTDTKISLKCATVISVIVFLSIAKNRKKIEILHK